MVEMGHQVAVGRLNGLTRVLMGAAREKAHLPRQCNQLNGLVLEGEGLWVIIGWGRGMDW